MRDHLPHISLTLLFLGALLLTHCGFLPDKTTPRNQHQVSNREQIGQIRFSNSMPYEKYRMIAKDLQDLRSANFVPPSEMLRILNIPNSDNITLVNWLEDRVHIVLEELPL